MNIIIFFIKKIYKNINKKNLNKKTNDKKNN